MQTSKTIDEIRSEYLDNKILLLGQKLSDGSVITDRRANHIIVESAEGVESKMFVSTAYELISEERTESYKSSNIPLDIVQKFDSIDLTENYYNHLHAMRAVDRLFESGEESDRLRAIKFLDRMEVLQEHQDYLDVFAAGKGIMEELKALVQEGIDVSILCKVYMRGLNQLTESAEHPARKHSEALARVQTFINTVNKLYEAKNKVDSEPLAEEHKTFEDHLDHIEKHPDEIDKLVSKVNDLEDIAHHYEDDDFVLKLDEHLSREERIKRKIEFTKNRNVRDRQKELALKRLSTPGNIKKKARRAAIELLKEKISKKPLDRLTVAEKDHLEDVVSARRELIDRMANKLAPKIRKIEQKRVYDSRHNKA